MKKFFAGASSLAVLLSSASFASAQTVVGGGTLATCPSADNGFAFLCNFNPSNVIPGLISLVFLIAIVAALFYLVWGGFKWLTSGGDKSAVQSAREHVIAAIVGLVIVFLSYFILNIFLQFFIGRNLGTFTIPTISH